MKAVKTYRVDKENEAFIESQENQSKFINYLISLCRIGKIKTPKWKLVRKDE